MNWITSKPALFIRKIFRYLGLNSIIANIIYGKGYETNFDKQLQQNIKKGDIVWDIGANIGHYTSLFSKLTGQTGSVIAFEPSPTNFSVLVNAVSHLNNVLLKNFGLGNENSNVNFLQGVDDLGATSRILDKDKNSNNSITVPIKVADTLIETNEVLIPNIIKIDVEGFEYEVIQGLNKTLLNHQVRVIGVEIHFRILEERKLGSAPKFIEIMLENAGFSINWTDSSHIIAKRNND